MVEGWGEKRGGSEASRRDYVEEEREKNNNLLLESANVLERL